jgi:tRNA nucleotidyltransferase (CCA-adding enzyme)
MTSPVKTIRWTDTLKNAEKTMTKYGVNVLPVVQDNKYKGIISREVIEKALFHGFSKNKVAEFCTTDALTVTPDVSIQEVEALMIEQNQRFMPIIRNKQIVGAITRTDLLRSMYENLLKKDRVIQESITKKLFIGKNLSPVMKEKFPKELLEILILAGKVAKDLNYSAYLVGGSVRDLFRGESNLDIDIVIEGNGITFARHLSKQLHAKVKTHQRFGTAVIITQTMKFDVATARTEYYESPAALPKIETSSIKKDLYRRDFTINTLAVKLNPENFGQLLDFFGGQRDLREKTIRVLHNLSFIEDPTRAFRAVRFAERFDFKLSKHIIPLIKTAVRINLFNKLSGSRLYDELNLIFHETEPLRTIKSLSELDLLKFIHPNLVLSKELEQTFESIQETLSWFKLLFLEEEINKSHLFLMAFFEGLKGNEREKALQRLAVPPRAKREILEGIEKSKTALSEMNKILRDEKLIYYEFKTLDAPTILFIIAKARDERQKKAISLFLTTLRKIKHALTGKDLKAMGYKPGPVYNKIFKSILDARLDGKIKSREEEIKHVKDHFSV